MKRIKIGKMTNANKDSILTRDHYYQVYLGNELTCYFSNQKKAKAFLAATNRLLNRSAQELNDIYISVWSAQRSIYLTYNYLFLRSWNLDRVAIIERSFDLLLQRSHWISGNHLTFEKFYVIVTQLNEWIDDVTTILKKSKKPYEAEPFNVLQGRIEFLKHKLDVWGKVHADKAPACFYDFRKSNLETLGY